MKHKIQNYQTKEQKLFEEHLYMYISSFGTWNAAHAADDNMQMMCKCEQDNQTNYVF